ncbi:hypothetical protein OR37_03555 [Caulobacter vibrioides OR37]|uniref:Uncharacterized protein n=1 Tax=Caulobacter vibrioides OR37 TaxID=1292034 RepID=R0EEP1_CAUVI|nr:hypothetical protein OR37_03555 [Caulobacter vibrioides OR37]
MGVTPRLRQTKAGRLIVHGRITPTQPSPIEGEG